MKNRIIWIDYVRVVAIFFVVLSHTSLPLLFKYNEIPKHYWLIADFYHSASRICVPLFFMISGFLLLGKEEALDVFFKKRLDKVIIPLLFWSLIYIFWQPYEGGLNVSWKSFYSLIIFPAYYHLWFMYAILGIYLSMPILRGFIKNSGSSLLCYYIVLWIFAISISPLIYQISEIPNRMDLMTVSGFSGYCILGLLLGNLNITKKIFIVAGITYLASLIVTTLGAYQLTAKSGGVLSEYFYGWNAPNVILASASSFILIKYSVLKFKAFLNEQVLMIVGAISSASLGIYLVHVIFLELLQKGRLGVTISSLQGHPIFSVPFTAMTIILLSYLVVAILQKIPLLRKTVP
jgi:surface polysaccharide O-acyltransferase-like enzyme